MFNYNDRVKSAREDAYCTLDKLRRTMENLRVSRNIDDAKGLIIAARLLSGQAQHLEREIDVLEKWMYKNGQI